jgi:hypothetical protein
MPTSLLSDQALDNLNGKCPYPARYTFDEGILLSLCVIRWLTLKQRNSEEVNEMEKKEPTSLAGQMARIRVSKDEDFVITFGPDVHLNWASGSVLNSIRQPELRPEITGSVKAENDADYSYIKDAELILDDKKVFKISFITKTYFTAHESINSRTRVSSE